MYLSAKKPRYGYRRLQALIEREGGRVNHERHRFRMDRGGGHGGARAGR